LLKHLLHVFSNIILLDEELERIEQSPTMQLAREVGSPAHKVQLMKASFFMEEEGDLEPGKFLNIRMCYRTFFDALPVQTLIHVPVLST